MTEEAKHKSSKIGFSSWITLCTFIVTIIALVPAFWNLNSERPRLFYSYILSANEPPDFVDPVKFRQFMKNNVVPSHSVMVLLKNMGNAPAEEIKLSVNVPGKVVRGIFKPSSTEQPIWVDLPPNFELGFDSEASVTTQAIQNMATDRLLLFGVGYESRSKETPDIEVYCNAQEATFIDDIDMAPAWNPHKVFYFPATVLGVGLLCTVLWVSGSAIMAKPQLRKELGSLASDILRSTFFMAGPLTLAEILLDRTTSEESEAENRPDNAPETKE